MKRISIWMNSHPHPTFFENDAKIAVTVIGIRYRHLITEFLWPQLDGMDLELMFQQDGATCNRFIAATISRTNDLKKFWCQLATKIMRFNAVRFLSMWFCEILGLYE